MNADFETELSQEAGSYLRLPPSEALNHRLAQHLLWLAQEGDALLLKEPWSESLQREAQRRGVELISSASSLEMSEYVFKPWGWTPSALDIGRRTGARVNPVPFDVVKRVNSKLWSHALEKEMGWVLKGARTASTFEELCEAVARSSPAANDKWVIKSPFGFAARERVLGRGPHLDEPQAKWSRKRLSRGETLIFQPWLEVIREYGTVMEIMPDGTHSILGISDLQTNGAGTGRGYILGRAPSAARQIELERVASVVAARLFKEGYVGPAGVDAREHKGGFHPLLEINARYTMGFVAVAVERSLKPREPTFWSLNQTAPNQSLDKSA